MRMQNGGSAIGGHQVSHAAYHAAMPLTRVCKVKSTYPADELSTGLGACLRTPSMDFPVALDLSCCLLPAPVPLALDFDAFATLPVVAAVPFILADTDVRGERPRRD